MRTTLDWKDLKEGDIFKVIMPSLGLRNIFWRGSSTLYTLRDHVISLVENPSLEITKHPSHPQANSSIQGAVQPVRCLDSLPPVKIFEALMDRVNRYTGSDPEIFVVRGSEHKTLLPAFRFLPTQETQQKAHPRGGVIGNIDQTLTAYAYRDGFAAECFIHPVHCHGFLINYLRDGLLNVLKAAQTFDRTAKLTIKNTFTIPEITMRNAAEEDIALGCMPSQNAYDDSPNLPIAARNFHLRFAGGHIHFDILPAGRGRNNLIEMVRACDVLAAIPAVAIFASIDSPLRRQFYGRAGEYRTPKYGLEYRVLSNAWLATPEVAHLILNLTRVGLKVGRSGFRHLLDIDEQAARDIINYCDVKAARKYVLDHINMFHVLLAGDGVYRDKDTDAGFKRIIEGGIEAIFPDFEDLASNWKLNQNWFGESNNGAAFWGTLCRRLPKA